MAKRKAEEESKRGAPAWMNTYGDMMTLLLTFFVLLFSMSEVDTNRFEAFTDSFHIGNGGNGVLNPGQLVVPSDNALEEDNKESSDSDYNLEKDYTKAIEEAKMVAEDLKSFISTNKLDTEVKVEQFESEVILRFNDLLLFDSGKASIKTAGVPVLSSMGDKISTYFEKGYRIRLEGHTDNIPIQNAQFPSNWELSAARAIAVAKFYINQMGFDPAKISTEGFGEHKPIASNDTAQGRSENRRVEIKLVKDN